MNSSRNICLRFGTFTVPVVVLLTMHPRFAQAAPDPKITAAVTAASSDNIEAIVVRAKTTGERIGTGEIKMSTTNVSALANGMANAVIAKVANPSDPNDPNRSQNKADEIGEIAAFIVDAIAANPKFQKTSKANPVLLSLMKGSLKTAKSTSALLTFNLMRDVAGSVALSLHNEPGISDKLESKFKKFLVSQSKAIAGKQNKAAIKTGFNEGFSGSVDANLKYEDGNLDILGVVADPETDFRNG